MKINVLIIALVAEFFFSSCNQGRKEPILPSKEEMKAVVDSIQGKMHIYAGKWRPHYRSEQIFWINPPWSSNFYIYVDFPEAIFVGDTCAYLSHVNPTLPTLFNYRLPNVDWKERDGVISYARKLENYMDFGGKVEQQGAETVAMSLWIRNKTDKVLRDITLQTCSFLYPIKEFSQADNANKFIHTRDSGWIALDRVWPPGISHGITENGRYRIGWRSGQALSDLPFIITTGESGDHHVAMTWFDHTLSFIGNPRHPCFHADPFFPDLQPGETVTIRGALIFYQGRLEDFEKSLKQDYPEYF